MSCSVQHGDHPSCALEPLRSSISPARLLPLHSVSDRSPAGLSRRQRRLRHEDEVPSRAGKRKRSPSRQTQTSARHFHPHVGRPDAKPRPDAPSLRATLDAPNALIRAVPRVCHREESRPEASSKEGTPATQGQREMLCSLQHGAGRSCPFNPAKGTVTAACLLALYSVSERSSAGLSRLQRGLRHEEEVPSVARKPKRSGY